MKIHTSTMLKTHTCILLPARMTIQPAPHALAALVRSAVYAHVARMQRIRHTSIMRILVINPAHIITHAHIWFSSLSFFSLASRSAITISRCNFCSRSCSLRCRRSSAFVRAGAFIRHQSKSETSVLFKTMYVFFITLNHITDISHNMPASASETKCLSSRSNAYRCICPYDSSTAS